jgi:phosphatidylserine decarboxylase
MTSQVIPNLYARNERFISIFDTAAGEMAVILVGAMIVGSMKTIWQQAPIRASHIQIESINTHIELQKGDELGYFSLGSTVILLFNKNSISWSDQLQAGSSINFGQIIGNI